MEGLSGSPSPSPLAMLELIPTPIPVEIAPVNMLTGNASVTAARLAGLIFPTKMESMVLYSDCIIMATIDGAAILNISFPIGSVPSLSLANVFIFHQHNAKGHSCAKPFAGHAEKT